MSLGRTLRLAIGFELLGVLLESISIIHTTPISFMLFIGVALPCLAVGVAFHLSYLFRRLQLNEGTVAGADSTGSRT